MSRIYEELEERGFIYQVSHEEVKDVLNNSQITFYIGFDMTADSLTVGHFQTLMVLKRLQEAGHRPIILIGGGTTLIGDPTGRDEVRKMLTVETIQKNSEAIKKQMEKFIDFSDGKAIMLNNADWLLKLNYLEFLRDYGPCFLVNRMIHMETYSKRLDQGLSLLEFNYMPMQAYDFLHLYRTENCTVQMGGSDQWSNILGGVDLIRRVEEGAQAYAVTFNLLTGANGQKMGKSLGGAIYLSAERTSPFDFFQYWRNVQDSEVEMLFKRLTMFPLDEIQKLTAEGGQALNHAKEVLAYTLTEMVHGKEEAEKALSAARALFQGGADDTHMPTSELKGLVGRELLEVLVEIGLIASKSEGRRLMSQNGLRLNDELLTDPFVLLKEEDFKEGGAIVRKGKKIFHKLVNA
ncbi:tyrosine--tRNA ligase [Guggenheimella bovis]